MSSILDEETSNTLDVFARFTGRRPDAVLLPPSNARLCATLWRHSPTARRLAGPQRDMLGIALRGHSHVEQIIGGRSVWRGSAPGTIILVRKGEETDWRLDGNFEQLQIYLDLDGDVIATVSAHLNVPFRDNVLLKLAQAVALAAREGYTNSKYLALLLEALQQGLVDRYLCAPAGNNAGRAEGGLSGALRMKIEALIDEHIAERITVEDLARVTRLSPGHFTRAFRQSYGTSPHQYLTGRRVALAAQLLRETSRPICDIAKASGFASPSHFGALFRRETGQPPTVFRRR